LRAPVNAGSALLTNRSFAKSQRFPRDLIRFDHLEQCLMKRHGAFA